MAKSARKPRKQSAVLEREGGQEMVGIGIIAAGLLLFVSLLKFTPVDFVDWKVVGNFAPEGAEDGPTQNLIGPLGALVGFVFVFLFGAASYLVAVGTIWLGVAVAWVKSTLGVRTLLGFGTLMLASAALFNVLGLFDGQSHGRWPGGALGEGVGHYVFQNLQSI